MAKPVSGTFADSHLQERTWKLRPILGDAYYSFKQIVDHVIENDVPYLIGAGDLINRRVNEPGPIIFLKQQLDRLRREGIKFLYVQGQHEMDEQPWLQLGDEGAVHLHHRTISVGGLGVRGLDFQPADRLKPELEAMQEDVDVVVCHQVWLDFMGEKTLPQGEIADVTQGKLLITGDYHKSVYNVKKYRRKDGQQIRVYSPGATHMLKIDEPCECSFGLLMSDGTIKRVPLRTRKFDQFAINTPEQLDQFLGNITSFLEGAAEYAEENRLPPELHMPLWRIVYSHRLSDLPGRVGKIVEGRAHLFWKENPPEPSEQSDIPEAARTAIALDKSGGMITLAGCLPQAVSQEDEPEVYTLCQRLLDATDPGAELAAWKKEILTDE